MQTTGKRYYRTWELARECGVNKETVRRWLRHGRVRFVQFPKERLIPHEEFIRITSSGFEERPQREKKVVIRGVYILMSPATGLYKIGKAINIKQRVSSYWGSIPENLIVVGYCKTDNQDKKEHELHLEYSNKRIKGEWFAMLNEDIENVKEKHGMVVINKPISEFLGRKST